MTRSPIRHHNLGLSINIDHQHLTVPITTSHNTCLPLATSLLVTLISRRCPWYSTITPLCRLPFVDWLWSHLRKKEPSSQRTFLLQQHFRLFFPTLRPLTAPRCTCCRKKFDAPKMTHLPILQHGISGFPENGRLQFIVHDEGLLRRMWLDGSTLPSSVESFFTPMASKRNEKKNKHGKINNWNST